MREHLSPTRGHKHAELAFRSVQRFNTARSDGEQAGPLRRRFVWPAVLVDEFDLGRDKQNEVGARNVALPPWGTRPVWH